MHGTTGARCEATAHAGLGLPASESSWRSPAAGPHAAGSGEADLYGTAIVDAHGVVRFCTAEVGQVLATGAECLVEQPIAKLIPELKLKRGTPGYNLAYALFWFPRQQWKEVQAFGRGGRPLALQVSISAARIDGKHHLVLALRIPAGSRAAVSKDSGPAPRLDGYAAARGPNAGHLDAQLAFA